MSYKIRDDAPCGLSLGEVVGVYEGVELLGNGTTFMPGADVPDTFMATVLSAYEAGNERLSSFIEQVDDKSTHVNVKDLKDQIVARNLNVAGSGANGALTKEDMEEAIKQDDINKRRREQVSPVLPPPAPPLPSA